MHTDLGCIHGVGKATVQMVEDLRQAHFGAIATLMQQDRGQKWLQGSNPTVGPPIDMRACCFDSLA